MEEMMASPMMQSLLSNPAFLENMLQSDPRLAQMAEKNPELRQALSNPSFLKEMSAAMKNPKVMKEMMRNQDRALSNIEGITNKPRNPWRF
jgi:ubiquilin